MSVLKLLKRRKFIKYGIGLAAGAIGGKGFYNTRTEDIESVFKRIKIKSLPRAFKEFKIALLSDIHASPLTDGAVIEKAVTLAMKQKPDMVALTGDFISSFGIGTKGKHLKQCAQALARLKAPHGIFAVTGNHEHWAEAKTMNAVIDELRNNLGVKWLRDEHVELNKGGDVITLLGIDDFWSGGSIHKAYRGVRADGPNILLSHNPDVNSEIFPQMRIDLILSGHTHGGQIVAPFIGAPFMPSKFGQKYRAGLVRDGDRQTYTTRGVGQIILPMRLNCPPEVTVIRLV